MRHTTAAMLVGTASVALAATMTAGSAAASQTGNRDTTTSASATQAFGLTVDQKLVRFDLDSPETPLSRGQITGLTGDTTVVGIDFRVQNGALYAVGDAGGVYIVNRQTAVARKVSQITVPLSGADFGVDFNPAADRLRVTSDNGQNLRHDVNTGGVTTVDGTLTYPPAATPASGISGSAYTNNDLDADTSTTLFDIDTMLDQVAAQAPANSGQLSGTGVLGVDAAPDAGFDIFSTVTDGKTESSQGYATLSVRGKYRLYTVNVLTGDADRQGFFPSTQQVSDIAVNLDRS